MPTILRSGERQQRSNHRQIIKTLMDPPRWAAVLREGSHGSSTSLNKLGALQTVNSQTLIFAGRTDTKEGHELQGEASKAESIRRPCR